MENSTIDFQSIMQSKKIHIRYDDWHFAKSTSRRFFTGLVLYTLAASFFTFAVGVLLAFLAPDIYILIEKSPTLILLLNSIAMYLVGTGVLYLTVKGSNVRKREKKSINIESIVILFLIGQFFTIAGNLFGTFINFIFTMLTGHDTTVSIDESLISYPIWCILLIVVIIGPIFEELVFRKLMIDRFSIYGDRLAIVISALSFGLFHGNLNQFFYTAAVGLIWGYVYVKSGKLRYSIFMHILMNFIGGFLPLYLINESAPLIIFNTFGLLTFQYGSAIAGFVLFIFAIIKKWFVIDSEPCVYIPKRNLPRFLIFNIGALLFLAICIFEIIVSHFPFIFLTGATGG